MTSAAKSLTRISRLKNVIKIAQGLGLPGAPNQGGGAAGQATGGSMAPTADAAGDPMGMAGGPNDLGVGSLTGGAPDTSSENINEQPEPGNKAPWGTLCPQCGSKDLDVANGEGTCNSCNAPLKFKFLVEVAPPDESKPDENSGMEEPAPMPTPPTGGIGNPEAAAGMPPAGTPAPTPGAPAMASTLKVMTKVAYKTTPDVYAAALSDNFDKRVAHKLPVGFLCPACGSREASKKSKHTFCYNCGTISISEVKRVEGEPGVIEASIVWI